MESFNFYFIRSHSGFVENTLHWANNIDSCGISQFVSFDKLPKSILLIFDHPALSVNVIHCMLSPLKPRSLFISLFWTLSNAFDRVQNREMKSKSGFSLAIASQPFLERVKIGDGGFHFTFLSTKLYIKAWWHRAAGVGILTLC